MMETDGLDALIVDLGRAPYRAAKKVTAVVHRGANNVTRDAKRLAAGIGHAPLYPRSIGYDMDLGAGTIAADIGPDKNLPQGALGNLLEYGSVNNAPRTHLGPALDREGPAFVAHVAAAGRDAVGG